MPLRCFGLLTGGALLLAVTPPVAALTPTAAIKVLEVSVEPSQVTLTHADDQQRLLVSAKLADGTFRDCTRTAQYSTANPAVAAVNAQGIVTPRDAGRTTIQVSTSGMSVTVPVTVQSAAGRPISFSHDVMPILAKAGCNSGACHGAASGKKGFKISLRGYDPATDFITLTRGTEGRRLNLNDPDHSLLFLKPTGGVPHEGGKRFDARSPYGRTLRRWIAEGALADTNTAGPLGELDVYPQFRSFPAPGLEQQLLVMARFKDGTSRDVTADARYSSNNENAADLDESGLVRMPHKGEAALMVRYGSMVAVSTVVVLKHDPAFAWNDPPENNYVDRLVHAKLKQMEIQPSDLTTDAEFLRRVYYDVIGLPPTPEETRAFLADQRADKRVRVIDALLERPEHAEFWALKWGDLFKIRFDLMTDKGTWGMYRWIRDSIAANKPFDQFVREVVAAQGSCGKNPAGNFWRVFQTPDDGSEAVCQVFLGIRLMCAKCHDHPFEKWVQTDYYGMSAFFSQVTRKAGRRPEDLVIFRTESAAKAQHPKTGQVLDPKFLGGASIPVSGQTDARELLAEWMTRKDNPLLARATVNRLWSHLFGRGIIDPVDDIRSSNPPVNGPLLDALTKDFLDHNYDVRYILRTMLNSRTYQVSARVNRFNADDRQNFSHAVPRRLSAEQLLDTLSQATGIRENFSSRYVGAGTVALPVGGVRAGQLPDRQLTAEMLELFGRPKGESTCACERHEEASMTQALHLINGKSVADRLESANGRLARLVQRPKITDAAIIEELYLIVLCRLPEPKELETMLRHFAASGNRLKATQDVMWVLFNTRELLFNH
jgi:hypothetical protein